VIEQTRGKTRISIDSPALVTAAGRIIDFTVITPPFFITAVWQRGWALIHG